VFPEFPGWKGATGGGADSFFLERKIQKIAIMVPHMIASPPSTPPTIAPIGVDECEELEVPPEELVDCTSWLDVIPAPSPAAPEELIVAAVAAGDSPGGYCVPVLSPPSHQAQ
jgi:hypothetical protein